MGLDHFNAFVAKPALLATAGGVLDKVDAIVSADDRDLQGISDEDLEYFYKTCIPRVVTTLIRRRYDLALLSYSPLFSDILEDVAIRINSTFHRIIELIVRHWHEDRLELLETLNKIFLDNTFFYKNMRNTDVLRFCICLCSLD